MRKSIHIISLCEKQFLLFLLFTIRIGLISLVKCFFLKLALTCAKCNNVPIGHLAFVQF